MEESKEKFYRLAYCYVKQEQDALDILSEATYRGFLHLGKLEKPEYFDTWMSRIIINCAYDLLKKQNKYELSEPDDSLPAEPEPLSIDDRLDLGSISGCLNRLLYNIPQGLKVGIFCYHDLIAVETLRLIKHRPEKTSERRLLIPDDVCVAGFDDLPIASAVTPPLTTISYRYASIAKKSFDIMLDHISNPDHKPGKYEISSSLIIRGSTVRKN